MDSQCTAADDKLHPESPVLMPFDTLTVDTQQTSITEQYDEMLHHRWSALRAVDDVRLLYEAHPDGFLEVDHLSLGILSCYRDSNARARFDSSYMTSSKTIAEINDGIRHADEWKRYLVQSICEATNDSDRDALKDELDIVDNALLALNEVIIAPDHHFQQPDFLRFKKAVTQSISTLYAAQQAHARSIDRHWH